MARIMKRVQFVVEMDVPDDDETVDTRPEVLPHLAANLHAAITGNNIVIKDPVHVEYRGYRIVHTDGDFNPPPPLNPLP